MRLRELLKSTRGRTMIVPMAHSDQVIHCVNLAFKKNLADFILIGNKKKIFLIAQKHNINISDAEFIELDDEEKACNLAATLIKEGEGQALMKGLVQTSTFLRALLDKKYGLVPPHSLLSIVSIFDIPHYHKALTLTDPGINIAPDLEQKVQIIRNALSMLHSLGIRSPKVACIAPVEKVNEKIPSTVHARELCMMDGAFGDAIVEGPFGLDVAVSRQAAEVKEISSRVAGDPDILLLPELNCGNAVYKSLTSFGNATVASIVAGLQIPVVLTSRSDSEETRFLSMQLAFSIAQTQ